MKQLIPNCCLTLVIAWLAAPAQAGFQYGFYGITNRDAGNTATGESQLSLDVSDAGSGLVRFQFDNAGPLASSITDVYFDDRAKPSLFLTSINTIENQTGVQFSENARPGNLPGGRKATPRFKATRGLTADSDSPVQSNGVNPGETLGILLELANGHIFNDVVAAIESTALRVGIHVQGFDNGRSESFINQSTPHPPPVVPEPSGLALFALGAIGVFVGRRWRQHRAD